jgi:hypothetical protein
MRRTIKIFLASSLELMADRREFEVWVSRTNRRLIAEEVFLELVIWEDFSDHLRAGGMMTAYKEAVAQCDIFVMLFATRVGPFTAQEFDAALTAFQQSGKPLIYTYFKDAPVQIGVVNRDDLASLLDFRKRLSDLGHFPTVVTTVAEWLQHFERQLARILTPPPPPPLPETQKILFLAANPSADAILQTDVEYRDIQEALRAGNHYQQFVFENPRFAVRVEDMLRMLGTPPAIIHFAGHGQEPGIFLEGKYRAPVLMTPNMLHLLFDPLRGTTHTVLLNACYSAEQAKEISKYGMQVVGHAVKISDSAALDFARGFYIGLGEGKVFLDAIRYSMAMLEGVTPHAADYVKVWKNGELVPISLRLQ